MNRAKKKVSEVLVLLAMLSVFMGATSATIIVFFVWYG